MLNPYLSVVIPAFNEERRIKTTLEAIYNYLSRQSYFWEVIIISDGSKDRTVELVTEFISNKKEFNFIFNTKNHGKGYVVRQGILTAHGKFRLFTDADNSTSIEQIEKFWPYLIDQNYDIVIGSIEVPGAQIIEKAQWYRRVLGHYSKYIIRFVAGLWEIQDTQRGFKLFSNRAAQDIFSLAKINRFGFDFEVLVLAKRLGYKIKEVPVTWNNSGESKVGLKSYLDTLWDLIRIKWYLWTNRYKT